MIRGMCVLELEVDFFVGDDMSATIFSSATICDVLVL